MTKLPRLLLAQHALEDIHGIFDDSAERWENNRVSELIVVQDFVHAVLYGWSQCGKMRYCNRAGAAV